MSVSVLTGSRGSRTANVQGANRLHSKVQFCWRKQELEAEESHAKPREDQEGEAEAEKR